MNAVERAKIAILLIGDAKNELSEGIKRADEGESLWAGDKKLSNNLLGKKNGIQRELILARKLLNDILKEIK